MRFLFGLITEKPFAATVGGWSAYLTTLLLKLSPYLTFFTLVCTCIISFFGARKVVKEWLAEKKRIKNPS